ncbi:MAG: PEP-CTERM sorting domain-containing protein [Thauera sp.]|nr:PEP-CTERM sorting domain-containing protein [Thauera sp.]
MKKIKLMLAFAACGLISQQAISAASWELTSGSNTSPVYGNGRTFTPATGSDPSSVNLTVTAFSATGATSNATSSNTGRNANDTIETAYLSIYTPSAGLGVVNRDGSNTASVAVNSSTGTDANEYVNNGSEHAMDNNGRSDVMLLTFTEQIALQSLKLGWSSGDSDVFILAWSGAAAPVGGITSQLNGKTFSQIAADTASDPANGWRLIDSLSNVGVNTTNFNTSAPVYSSYWLIGTGGFNSAATGGGVTSGDKNSSNNWIAFGSTGASYDYVKLAAVGGSKFTPPPPPPGIPEPGSLALAGAAFLGMVGLRRRKAAA